MLSRFTRSMMMDPSPNSSRRYYGGPGRGRPSRPAMTKGATYGDARNRKVLSEEDARGERGDAAAAMMSSHSFCGGCWIIPIICHSFSVRRFMFHFFAIFSRSISDRQKFSRLRCFTFSLLFLLFLFCCSFEFSNFELLWCQPIFVAFLHSQDLPTIFHSSHIFQIHPSSWFTPGAPHSLIRAL